MINENQMRKMTETNPKETGNEKYQTVRLRFWAAFIDSLVLAPVSAIMLSLFIFVAHPPITYFLYSILGSFFLVAYNVLMVYYKGGTVGKLVMGLQVVHFQTEGKVDIMQSIFREALNILSLLFLVFAVISVFNSNTNTADIINSKNQNSIYTSYSLVSGIVVLCELVTALFNKKKRAVHDFLGQTVVIIKTDKINKVLSTILVLASIGASFALSSLYGTFLYRLQVGG